MSSEVSIIAIVARNGAIGRSGDQPFHIREDFQRFKALTMGRPIVMGRRTFEALPKGALPGRRNIVVTRNASWTAEGVETAPTLEDAIALGASASDEVMIIGGGEIYRQALPLATQLYLTEVDADVVDADTFFPSFDRDAWQIIEESPRQTDPRSGATYRFVTYRR